MDETEQKFINGYESMEAQTVGDLIEVLKLLPESTRMENHFVHLANQGTTNEEVYFSDNEDY